MMFNVRSICAGLAVLAAFAASAQETVLSRTEEEASAFGAVAKAWSLPADASGATQVWPGDRPEDLASAVLLWKNGGPVPAEGWQLRLSEKSWEGAARKAGAPVEALLREYRSLVNDQTRDALAGTGEEWVVLAEIRTLERLTGRGSQAVASQLATSDFQTLLLAALPVAGPPASPQRPSASPEQAPTNQWQVSDPISPMPMGNAPKNTVIIEGGAPTSSR